MPKPTAVQPRTGAMRATNLFKGFGTRARSAPGDNQPIAEIILTPHSGVRLEILDDFEKSGLVWMWAGDAEGNLIYVSPSAAERLGHAVADLLGRHLTDLFETDPDNPNERSDRSLNFQISARNRITDLIVRLAPSGILEDAPQSWWMICAHPKFDESGQFLGYRGTAKDVTVKYERKVHDKQLAQYDSLTGLANRHRLNKRLDTVLAAYKAAKRHCALMMLDLDRFKHVNDTLGHQAGDELLKQAGDRLKSIVGTKGEIGRLGGDEFEIILPDIDDRGVLGELAGRVIQMLAQPYSIGGERARVGASVGIAIAPYDGLERSDMMKSADMALYAAKNAGRSQL
ncbi:MAG: diguanylate cyclase, partial [Hyphomicrobiales bacterium]